MRLVCDERTSFLENIQKTTSLPSIRSLVSIFVSNVIVILHKCMSLIMSKCIEFMLPAFIFKIKCYVHF